MTRRFLIFSFAAGLLALGGLNAQAGLIPLPATLGGPDNLVPPPAGNAKNYAIVGNLEFSNFGYTAVSPPSASSITVNPITGPPAVPAGETGIQFAGASFTAAANQTVDYTITYTVTTTDGSKINDAYLSLGGFVNFGGTGYAFIGETLKDTNGNVISTSPSPFQVFTPGQLSQTVSLTSPETEIFVEKDITVVGGSLGAAFSVIDQGYSTTAIPEPASMALLGIGLSGLFTLRRLFRRTSVA